VDVLSHLEISLGAVNGKAVAPKLFLVHAGEVGINIHAQTSDSFRDDRRDGDG
jgi:hypothetical protein